ncbi:MAG: pyridoxamine 5'-phosphate oxidase family protein [Dehalococcoidia bacterium]
MAEGLTEQERDAFLKEARYGILTHLRKDGSPVAVPVWFEWDGSTARMFTSGLSSKVKRLENDPRVSLLVSNAVDEPEMWIALDGEVQIHEDGDEAIALAERMAARYWDLSDEGRQQSLQLWRKAAAVFRVIELKPRAIRAYKD